MLGFWEDGVHCLPCAHCGLTHEPRGITLAEEVVSGEVSTQPPSLVRCVVCTEAWMGGELGEWGSPGATMPVIPTQLCLWLLATPAPKFSL